MSARSSHMGTKPPEEAEAMAEALEMQSRIPGRGSFTVARDAAAMLGVFGGTLHC